MCWMFEIGKGEEMSIVAVRMEYMIIEAMSLDSLVQRVNDLLDEFPMCIEFVGGVSVNHFSNWEDELVWVYSQAVLKRG